MVGEQGVCKEITMEKILNYINGKLVEPISKKYLDKMEFNTDRICIQHGLGKYLLAYSKHVREVMHVHNWRGSDYVNKGNGNGKYERYMNPDTIEKTMQEMETH